MTTRRMLPLLCLGLLALGCRTKPAAAATVPAKRQAPYDFQVAETALQGKLGPGWNDFGYAPHGKAAKGVALDLSKWSGWILARPGLKGRFGGLTFRYRAPKAFGDFLEVKLRAEEADSFPRIQIGPDRRTDTADGWSEVWVSMDELNPYGEPWDRIFFKAIRNVSKEWVLIDGVALTALDPARPPPGKRPAGPPRPVSMAIDCRAPSHRISPLIYGIASSPRLDAPLSQLGATAARWGGNTSTRYNWELGNAWNSGSDWFFRNTNYSNRSDFSYQLVLEHHRALGVATALTVPLLGWVAKDTSSASFPVSEFGRQQGLDPDHPAFGNGLRPDGAKIEPGPPSRTSVAAPPEFVGRWVKAIRAQDKAHGGRSVAMYFLDNEPDLWNDTHRDVHPRGLSYDELLEKTLAYGKAVRQADPEAVIAGPASWGWTGYFYSALDMEKGARLRPDRRAHGDVPLLPWYLSKLREHEAKTGERLLDVLDVHYYPQGKGLGLGEQGRVDPATAALRIRSTRSLWDPSYTDESWVSDNVELIPRLRRWIDENYPGRGISIGEYNFGAENHQSGGLAQAEALGRFGQHNLTAAFYWRAPPLGSPSFWAFRAYRNFDGRGAHFLDWSVASRAGDDTSLFASRDERGGQLIAVALNFDPERPANAAIALQGCAAFTAVRAFEYGGGPDGFAAGEARVVDGRVEVQLPPYSMTVLDLRAPARAPKE